MSEIPATDAPLPNGRTRTDKSLEAERAKTDESLMIERERTESRANHAVSSHRIKVDEARSQSRLDADAQRETERASQGASGPTDDQEADDRLRLERQTADEALVSERRHVDSVLESERWRKKAAERRLFHAERTETDRDLTSERHLIDAEVHRATSALTTRDEFLAIVTHDLRNPLGSISIAADLLAEGTAYANADAEERQFLDLIGRSAREALRLISDLLDMERMAVGKLALESRFCDVREIIQHALEAFQPQGAAKRLSLQMSATTVDTPVYCDRDRIAQVLSNLIGNAIKFSPEQTAITIAVDAAGQDEVRVSVTDQGPGIADDMRGRVFEKFRQLGKPDRDGLGLGLYISTKIVAAHHGRIWVDSKLGKGSSFRFTLPTVDRHAAL